MSEKEYREYIKKFLDGITDMTDLKMIYGMARAAFRNKKKAG